MSSVENDPQFQLLFKQFNNTVNTRQDVAFSDGNNLAPFRNYVFNNEVFSNNIPADLSNISFGSGSSTVYGLAALDASFNANGIAKGTSYNIPGTDLTFFFRQELEFTNLTTNRTYWIDACNNNSALADTIPFNYDRSQFNSYEPLLFDNAGVVKVPIFKSGAPGLKWLMDYKSGFVQFYGTDSNVNAWAGGPPPVPLNNAPPRLSYIKYTGPKGAAGGGGGGGGGDSSFNDVDISGTLNVDKIIVDSSASFPLDTLVQPIFYALGSGTYTTTEPFYDKQYIETKQYDAILVDPAVNPVTDTDWITIARVAELSAGAAGQRMDGRADATFKISHPESGRHETITFIASFKYARGMSINVLQHDWYSGPDIQALRIAYDDSAGSEYLYNGCVLQMKLSSSLASGRNNAFTINISNNNDYPGWIQYTDISGAKTIRGISVPYAIPNNNPTSLRVDPSGVPYNLGGEFVLDDLTWNPNPGLEGNAHQITTNPARFTRQIDVGGDITSNDIKLTNIERFRFISNNASNTLIPVTGSASGYYKIASVDDMKVIKTTNLAETVTQANIQFFTRVNFEDSGTNTNNKLQWNGNFDIGVNQTYTFAIAVNPDSFINTNHCLLQAGGFTFPFESLHIVQNPATSKYELYLKFNQYTQLNKYIDLTVVLKPNNENTNPISSKVDNTASNNINWELEPITTPIGTLPTPASGRIPASIILSREGQRSWGGTMLPFFGDRDIATYGNTLLQKYTFENYNSGGSNDFIAQIQQGDPGPKMLAASGLFKLFARGQPAPGAAPIYTQEIIANIGIQVTGTGGGSALNEQSFLNVLSNTTSITGNNLINNINIERSAAGSGFYEYIVTITPNPTIGIFDLHCELTNNNLNPEVFSGPGEKRYWTINKYGSGGSGTLIKRVDTRSPLDSFAAFNNERFLVNKLGMGGGNSSGYGILTEDDSILDSAIQTNIGADGNNMIINKLEDGAVVIDAKTPTSTSGGLKIFNSGTSALPQISLIPFTGPSTLGNPTFINANSSGSTQFQGSGNLSILNGIQNFGSLNFYQGNGTTAAASNIFNSEDLGSSRYRVSLNNSRNDTDVVINTPGYNIVDPSGGGAAIEVDSGLDKVIFNAPVDFENAVNFNSTVNGQNLALYQEIQFNTSGLSTSSWFTLAQTGDGTDRNALRSDALFVLEDRVGSHHHNLVFRAGAKFNSGIYLDVIQSSWYNVPRIQALRIAYFGTYDGSVLQAQLNTDTASISTSTMKLRIYQNKNSSGWLTNTTILPTVPVPNNSPTVYVTDSPNNPGAVYPDFRESGDIIYDGNGRNTTQTTTSNFLINESALQVREGRNVDLKVSEQNIVLRNTGATSGNILLDTVGTTNENIGSRGISIVSHNGIYLQGSNANTSSSILLKTYGNNTSNNFVRLTANSGPNPSTPGTDNNLTWSVAGLDVDELNISNINNLYGGPNTRTTDMVIRSDNRGLATTATAVHITNPLRFPTSTSTTTNSAIDAQSYGTMAYDYQLNSIVCKPNSTGPGPGTDPIVIGTATEITLWDKLTTLSTSYVGGTGAYTRGNISNRHFYWPISAGPVPATGTAFEFYKAPFDGYIVGADFGGTPFHQTSLPAFSIQRFSGFNIPGSRLVLEVGVGGFASGTISEIGTILTGPANTATGVISTTDIRWQFQINPSQNRITFQAGQSLDFRLRYISAIFNDQIRASWNDYTSNGTLVNLNLNLVYIIPH